MQGVTDSHVAPCEISIFEGGDRCCGGKPKCLTDGTECECCGAVVNRLGSLTVSDTSAQTRAAAGGVERAAAWRVLPRGEEERGVGRPVVLPVGCSGVSTDFTCE